MREEEEEEEGGDGVTQRLFSNKEEICQTVKITESERNPNVHRKFMVNK